MKINQSNRWFWVVFSVFLLGYVYAYSQLLVLYLVNVPLGIVASVVFPLFVRVLFPWAMKWMTSQWTKSDVAGYSNVKGYIRVWSLRLEWGLFIPSILILSGLVPDGVLKSVLWIVLGIGLFFGYPRYVKPVVHKSVADETVRQRLESVFITVGSLIGAGTLVIGSAGILLSMIGKLVQ